MIRSLGLLALLSTACFNDYNKVDSICGPGTCEGESCAPQPVAVSPGEAISVVLFNGTRPIFSTGYGVEMYEVLEGGGLVLLANSDGFPCPDPGDPDRCYVTDMVIHNGRVYWTQYNGDEIWSVSPDAPLVAIRHAINPGHTIRFARIAAHGEYVYWASEAGTDPVVIGGIWRIHQSAEDETAEGFETDDSPYGVAADDTHVYWTDQIGNRIRRVPVSDFDAGSIEEVIDGLSFPLDIQLVGDTIYFTDSNAVFSLPKAGGDRVQLGGASGYSWKVQVDGEYAYWTDDDTAVRRARLDGSVVETVAVNEDNPRGLAVGCDAVYFTTYPSDPPGRVFKAPK